MSFFENTSSLCLSLSWITRLDIWSEDILLSYRELNSWYLISNGTNTHLRALESSSASSSSSTLVLYPQSLVLLIKPFADSFPLLPFWFASSVILTRIYKPWRLSRLSISFKDRLLILSLSFFVWLIPKRLGPGTIHHCIGEDHSTFISSQIDLDLTYIQYIYIVLKQGLEWNALFDFFIISVIRFIAIRKSLWHGRTSFTIDFSFLSIFIDQGQG